MLREGDDILADSQSVANVFGEHFKVLTQTPSAGDGTGICIDELSLEDICHKYENNDSIKAIKDHAQTNDFMLTHVCEREVHTLLSQLNKKKATGYDGLPAKLIVKVSNVITPTITRLVNLMIDQSNFPKHLKCAEISPVFKKADRLDKTNYRPVSILPCVSKIFEKVINAQISNHFYTKYAQNLSAYRKQYNTQCVLLKAVDDWKRALDERKFAAALLMDLSKAFDVIPHGLLVAKLCAYGYKAEVVLLMKNYLGQRKQRVKVDDARSDWTDLTQGVPQGSVLGPTLFNIFLNDLFYTVSESSIYNYADDNTLSVIADTMDELVVRIERDGSLMTKWFNDNQMLANPDKYQTIIFGKKVDGSRNSFDVGGVTIPVTSDVKLLGVNIDENLAFNLQASIICKKAGGQVNALMRLSRLLSRDVKRHIYNAFIYSNFTYCPSVWLMCSKENMKQLEKINCRALRFLYNDFDATYEELLAKGNHRAISVVLLHSIAIEVFKAVNGLSPEYMTNMFRRQDHRHNVRNQHGLVQIPFRTVRYGYNSFGYLGAKVWNSLPNDMKCAQSLSMFKKQIARINDTSCLHRLL